MTLPSVPFLAKTKVSWTGEQDEDLGFLENEVVKVFNIVDELWWQGSLSRNGAEGIFPKDFVEVIPSSQAGPTPRPPTNVKSALTPALVSSSSLNKLGRRSNPVTPVKAEYRSHDRSFDRSFDHSHDYSGTYGNERRPMVTSRLTPAVETYDHSFDDTFDRSFQNQSRSKVKPARLYSQHVLNLGLTKQPSLPDDNIHIQTKRLSKLMTPESSPMKLRVVEQASAKAPKGHDEFYHTISQKKQELEMQLQKLKQLEKLLKLPVSCDSSYLSEELLLSTKQNCFSKDDIMHSVQETVYSISDEEDAPPPPPPKHKTIPFDADEFRASGATMDALLKSYSQYPEELKNSIKSLQSDVLNLSELSATSAGSFIRHKNERDFLALRNEFASSNDGSHSLTMDEDSDLMNSMFKNKKNRQANLLMKLIRKKPEQNALEARLETDQKTWQQVKMTLNRVNSLISLDKQTRTKRVVRSEPNFIVKPFEYISEINTSETYGPEEIGDFEIETNIRRVAEFLKRYDGEADFNDLISDISVKFGSSRADQVRAVLLHLCKFHIIEEGESILRTKPKLREVMAKGEATIYQLNYLFKKLLEALNIPSEVVLGFWKKPNEFYHSDQFLVNHCWLSVMMESPKRNNGSFRMIDLLCYQKGLICNIQGANEFYFLTKPLDLVSTHIPSVVELQHVFPPIDLNVAFHLPRMYSSFQRNDLEFINYNNALTRMQDLEIFEADIRIPESVEIFTLIKASNTTSNDYTLAQVFWNGLQRIARIKASLPEKETIGVLQIFAGPKGLQAHFDNIHELACVIPLYHSGVSKKCTFVPRYPTIQSQINDLYIKQPQTSIISIKNSYNFEIEAHPSLGPNSTAGNANFKLVIESPSGKYTKLISDGPEKTHGTFRANILCQEQGTYRGLVIGDSGNSWYVFAQWECCSS